MKRSLHAALRSVVFFFLLSFSLSALASAPALNHSGRRIPLTLSAPADVTVATDPWLNMATNVVLGQPVVAADPGTAYTISNDAPAGFPIGTTSVTWKVADDQGNTATAVQKVTVEDKEKPFIFRRYEIAVVNDPGQCGAVVQLMTPDYYDNSGGPVTFTNDAPAYFPVGSRWITWTATDQYGNSDTSTQLITVIDNELPNITIADVTVNAAAGKSGAIVALGTPVVSDNCSVVSVENDAPAFFPTGTTLVHWTVTDPVGFTNVTIQKVTVLDTEKPTITAPSAITLQNSTGKCGYEGTLTPPAVSDNSGLVSITNNAPAVLPTGTTLVTWTATDASGNQSTATQSVTVKDLEAPVFAGVPTILTVSCDAVPPATTPTVKDNCTASPAVTLTQSSTQSTNTNSLSRYNYTITRTWTAKDAAGNTSSFRQVITVQDKTAPFINAPANIVKSNDANTCGALVSYTASATDGCGGPVTLSYSQKSGTVFSTGTTTVTITAKDLSGNIATRTFLVTVNDKQKPTVKAPSNVSVTTTGTSVPKSSVQLGTPAASDNCGIKSITNNAPANFPVGTTTVTWTVTDVNDNTATASQTVTVSTAVKRRNETGASTNSIGTQEESAGVEEIKVSVSPNPSKSYFTLRIQGGLNTPVNLRVVDVQGRVVDSRSKLDPNSSIQVGQSYAPGIYFAEMTQGTQRKVIQLLKVR